MSLIQWNTRTIYTSGAKSEICRPKRSKVMCKCRDLISELENVIAAQNRIIIEQAIEIEQLHLQTYKND